MAIPASQLDTNVQLRLLILGPAKCGKSTCAIATAPGPVRVLLCEDDNALRGASRRTKNFDFERVKTFQQALKYIVDAKREAAEGKIKTLVVDPLTELAEKMMEECFKESITSNGKENGLEAYGLLARRLSHVIDLLRTVPCHVIILTHYIEVGAGLIDGQMDKTGEGILPLIPGRSRTTLAAKFSDIIWMEARRKAGVEERVFVLTPRGSFGPGCRSLEGKSEIPADIGELLKHFEAQAKADRSTGLNGKPVAKATKPLPPTPGARR